MTATDWGFVNPILAVVILMMIILVLWILLHHGRPAVKVDVGVRAWLSLSRPKPPDDDDDIHRDGGDTGQTDGAQLP